ncbi:MAG: hypothetical protein ACXWPM_12115 [Bdellovibrionota bacterium]
MANRQIAVVEAIGRVTFFEILRDKILYNIVIFSVLLLGIGFLASKLSFARPDRAGHRPKIIWRLGARRWTLSGRR